MKTFVALSLLIALAAGGVASWSLARLATFERSAAQMAGIVQSLREEVREQRANTELLTRKVDILDYDQERMLAGLRQMLTEPPGRDVQKLITADLDRIEGQREFDKQMAYLESIGAPQEAQRLRELRLKVAEIMDRPR